MHKAIILAAALALAPSVSALAQQGPGQQNMQIPQQMPQATGVPLYLSPAVVRDVQLTLNREGFPTGPANGIWDNQTTNALNSYQQAQGLEPTGTLNPPTLHALHVPLHMLGERLSMLGEELTRESANRGTAFQGSYGTGNQGTAFQGSYGIGNQGRAFQGGYGPGNQGSSAFGRGFAPQGNQTTGFGMQGYGPQGGRFGQGAVNPNQGSGNFGQYEGGQNR